MELNQNNKEPLSSSKKKGLFIQIAIAVLLSALLISSELTREETNEDKYVRMVQEEIAAVDENYTGLSEVKPELVEKKGDNEKDGLNQVDETVEEPANKIFYIVQEMPSFHPGRSAGAAGRPRPGEGLCAHPSHTSFAEGPGKRPALFCRKPERPTGNKETG